MPQDEAPSAKPSFAGAPPSRPKTTRRIWRHLPSFGAAVSNSGRAPSIGRRRRTIQFWLGWLVVACVLPAALLAAFLIRQTADLRQALLLNAAAVLLLLLGIVLARTISGRISRAERHGGRM